MHITVVVCKCMLCCVYVMLCTDVSQSSLKCHSILLMSSICNAFTSSIIPSLLLPLRCRFAILQSWQLYSLYTLTVELCISVYSLLCINTVTSLNWWHCVCIYPHWTNIVTDGIKWMWNGKKHYLQYILMTIRFRARQASVSLFVLWTHNSIVMKNRNYSFKCAGKSVIVYL